jgi:hypothetical protein
MNQLERFLATHPYDPGCEQTRRWLHVYVDALLTGEDPGLRLDAIAAHLRDCPPCAQERDGLMAAVSR